MIHVGVDAIEIARFKEWHMFSFKKLNRIFTNSEIAYCLSVPGKEAERFAVRFAAKEALYKALCSYTNLTFPLLTLCRYVELVKKDNGCPSLVIDWAHLGLRQLQSTCSLTHTQNNAIAVVIIEN